MQAETQVNGTREMIAFLINPVRGGRFIATRTPTPFFCFSAARRGRTMTPTMVGRSCLKAQCHLHAAAPLKNKMVLNVPRAMISVWLPYNVHIDSQIKIQLENIARRFGTSP